MKAACLFRIVPLHRMSNDRMKLLRGVSISHNTVSAAQLTTHCSNCIAKQEYTQCFSNFPYAKCLRSILSAISLHYPGPQVISIWHPAIPRPTACSAGNRRNRCDDESRRKKVHSTRTCKSRVLGSLTHRTATRTERTKRGHHTGRPTAAPQLHTISF